jgi:hypothetical protein
MMTFWTVRSCRHAGAPAGSCRIAEQVGEELMKKNADLFVVPEFHAAEMEYLVSAELTGL